MFLSEEWIADANARLGRAVESAAAPSSDDVRVVLEFDDAPASELHALTFSIVDGRASLSAGDHLGADLIVRLSYADAQSLARGELDSSSALRDGRLKLRGDVNALVPYGAWMVALHNDFL